MMSRKTDFERDDARGKATGAAYYTQDIYPNGLLFGAVTRSPYAAARIIDIDSRPALAIPGVVCVLTSRDLPDRRYGFVTQDEPIVASDVVRYVGEPVALIAANSRAAAAEAAICVRVRYEPLPAVIRLEDALGAEVPRVHSDRDNRMEPATIRRGDVQLAFAEAHVVVETTVRSQRAHQSFIEPRVALARLEDQRILVTMCSQSPFAVRQGLAHLFDIPMSRIRVDVPALGGGFGGKLHLGMAPYAVALALETRRPVQVVCSRAEEFQSSAPRENSVVRLESAVDADGRIRARRATIFLDSGAYAYDTEVLASVAAMQAAGPYSVAAVEATATAVYTNTPPTGSFRGPTGPQMVYANEAHIGDIARQLGLSSMDVRSLNIVRRGDIGPSGQLLTDPGMEDCLERVTDTIRRWRANPAVGTAGRKHRGYGLACAWWTTEGAGSGATVAMNEDGTAVISTGATEIGTGAVAAGLVAIAAEELGISVDRIRVVSGTTDAPYDVGSEGSRTLYGAGNAVLAAAAEVKQILAEHVADNFEADPDDIVFADGRVGVAGSPQTSVPIDEAVAAAALASGPVVGKGRVQAPSVPFDETCVGRMFVEVFNEPTFHCHGAEVDVDEETGIIEVLRYTAAHDIGNIVYAPGVKGQIEGGIIQGLGYALFEEIQIDDRGYTRNPSLVDYRLPTIGDIPPELETVLVSDHPSQSGPFGVKGIGEAPVILPAAAIGAALYDTFGQQPMELPLDPMRILAWLQDALALPT